MDTLSHGLAGSFLTRTLTDARRARTALVLGFVTAMLPDLDYIGVGGIMGYLRWHRGWTHSFVLLPLVSFGLALLANRLWRDERVTRLWLFCAAGQASHILFDWITSFGTMFFTPITRHRYSLDWVFILDPYFSGISALALIAVAVWRERARRIAGLGAGLLFGYIGFCAVLHVRALTVWKALDHPPAGAQVAAVPQFLSPFRWLGLSEHATEVHVAFFDIGPFAKVVEHPRQPQGILDAPRVQPEFYPPPERALIRRFPKAPESAARAAARALSDVRTYREFARFPLETVAPGSGGLPEYWIQDLRFLPFFAGPFVPGETSRPGPQPFVYRVRLNAAGDPIERAFVSGSR